MMSRTTKKRIALFGMAMLAGLGVAPATFGQAQPRPESPLVAPRKAVADAEAAARTAKTAVDAARTKVLVNFRKAQPDYAKAEQDATKAQADMVAAKNAALVAARNKPEYRAASAAKLAAQEKLRSSEGTEGEAVRVEFQKQATAMGRIEKEALDTDPKLAEAKTRSLEAGKQLEVYKPQIDDACKADPEYVAAEQTQLTAQQAVVTAKESLTAAQKAAAESAKAARATTATPAKGKPR